MRGRHCGMHPPERLGKKWSACGRTDKAVEVEDHGNGFMFIGCSDIEQAERLLEDYVDNPEDYRFRARPYYAEVCCVWMTTAPGEVWEGARDPLGNLVPRGVS